MKKRGIILIAFCLLLGIVTIGCGQKKTEEGSAAASAKALAGAFIGTWTQITDDGSPSLPDLGIPSGYIFYDNETGVDLFWDMPFTYSVTDKTLHISYNDKTIGEDTDYQYTFEGDTLSLTRENDPEAVTMLYQKTEQEKEETAK